MKKLVTITFLVLLYSIESYSQKFFLGDNLSPSTKEFSLIGISSSTGVSAYKFIGVITDKYFYGRKIDTIIVGIKDSIIVTTVYNLIPESGDVGVPKSIVDQFQSAIPFKLGYSNGTYGATIDNVNYTLSRISNDLTFYKDRIMFFTSVKNSLLKE